MCYAALLLDAWAGFVYLLIVRVDIIDRVDRSE